jgi:hypothetical protein
MQPVGVEHMRLDQIDQRSERHRAGADQGPGGSGRRSRAGSQGKVRAAARCSRNAGR